LPFGQHISVSTLALRQHLYKTKKKQKIKKYTTLFEQFLNQKPNIVERGNIDTPSTHAYNRSLSWLGTDT